jgi:hypothetical protein
MTKDSLKKHIESIKSAFKEEPKEERVLREEKALKDLKELAKAKGYKEGWAIKKQKR